MRFWIMPALAGILAGCAVPAARQTPTPTAASFSALPGWASDHVTDAMPAFVRGCARIALAPPDQRLGASQRGGQVADWHDACTAARALPPGDEPAARAFLQHYFDLVPVAAPAQVTGFYEPEVPGSREKVRGYNVAALTRPHDLADQTAPGGARQFGRLQEDGSFGPYYTRAEIDAGALRRQRLDLIYLRSLTDLYLLQIQGAGRVDLPNGKLVRLAYDAGNGQPNAPIGQVLQQQGQLPPGPVSAAAIRDWLRTHPRQARAVMQANPSYVFFREAPDLTDDLGPAGALGVQLQALRSVAVNPASIPLGAPVWLSTILPDGTAFNRLVLAQDTDGALPGASLDLFFGWGEAAENTAGGMDHPGRAWLLLPRAAQPDS